MRKLIPSSDRACYLQFTGMSQVNENAARRFKYSRRAYRDPSFNVQDRVIRRYITTPIIQVNADCLTSLSQNRRILTRNL